MYIEWWGITIALAAIAYLFVSLQHYAKRIRDLEMRNDFLRRSIPTLLAGYRQWSTEACRRDEKKSRAEAEKTRKLRQKTRDNLPMLLQKQVD